MTGRELRKKRVLIPAALLLAGYFYLDFSVLSTQWAIRLNLALWVAFGCAVLLARRQRTR